MKKINYMKVMMMISLMAISSMTFAQDGNIFGQVTDSESSEVLIGAQIYVPSLKKGTVSDVDGNYSLNLPTGSYLVKVSYIGYTTISETIEVSGQPQTKNFPLVEDRFALDAVVVTGTFAERSLFNSPQSLIRVDAKDLSRLTANSQSDILRTVPGIHAEGGGGEVASNVFVRGLPSGGQYQFTPLQVDGLPVLSAFGLNSSAHDVYFRNDIGIENLEFVRGGVSTLFGAGSVAGIINYTSATGGIDSKNRVNLEWAEGGRAKTEFLTSGPINDRTFYAVSGFYRYDEGPLETGLNTEGVQLRGNVKNVSKDGNGVFKVSGQFIDDNVQFYLPYPLQNDNGTYSRPIGNDGEEVFTMLTGQATDFSFDTPNGRFETPIGNGVTTKGGYLMLDLKREFANDWALSAKAKYANYDHNFNLFLDGDGTHNVPETQADYLTDRELPQADATFTYIDNGQELAAGDLLFENRVLDRERPMREMVNEINLSKEIGNHTITVGTFNSYTNVEDNNWIWSFLGDFSNSPRVVGLTYQDSLGVDVNYSTGGFISGSQTSNKKLSMRKTAFYAADQIVTDKYSLDFGFRYERAKGVVSYESGIGSNTFTKGEVEASDVAIAIAGLYKLSKSTNLYLNGSSGYFFPELRSVKFLADAPGVTQSYETEKIIQAEGGVKYAKSSLSASVAAYYVTLKDRRNVTLMNDGNGGLIETSEIQDTRTIGLEASLSYYVTKNLNVYGNLTYQQHELTRNEGDATQEGNWLQRQPRVMGMLGITYDNGKFDGTLSNNFIGKKFANGANTVELEGYGIGRLDAGYTLNLGDRESMRFGLSVYNLLDADGVTEGSPRQGNSQIGGGEFFVGRPILPRRIFARLTFNF